MEYADDSNFVVFGQNIDEVKKRNNSSTNYYYYIYYKNGLLVIISKMRIYS